MNAAEAYAWLLNYYKETAYLKSMGALLAWDQRTQMPAKGHAHRNVQRALLAKWIHERDTAPQVGERLARVEGQDLVQDPLSAAAVNIREWQRTFRRAGKIPPDLAVALAEAAAEGETTWEQAQPRNDWQTFQPFLERIVALKREEAEALGYEQEPYDALLDDYEPGERAARLELVFSRLRPALVRLLEAIQDRGRQPDTDCLSSFFPGATQETFARLAAGKIGYDFEAGRLDPTAHPFAVDIGPGDVRITTRYDEHGFAMAFFGVIHETGHALYEQGLPPEHWGAPAGEAISLGIHESQSRLWENLVARSRGFWEHFYPLARQHFAALDGVPAATFLGAVNQVQPSLIRTEADEVTYNLHVLLRFELERALLRGDLKVSDLPGAWNERVQAYLGLTPPDFRQGVMQDVHWSAGLVGYFPTYTLGNLYAAQFFARAEAELGNLETLFSQGLFNPLLQWLRQHIHRQGCRYWPRQLVQTVTGQDLQPDYLIAYLERKFGELYRL